MKKKIFLKPTVEYFYLSLNFLLKILTFFIAFFCWRHKLVVNLMSLWPGSDSMWDDFYCRINIQFLKLYPWINILHYNVFLNDILRSLEVVNYKIIFKSSKVQRPPHWVILILKARGNRMQNIFHSRAFIQLLLISPLYLSPMSRSL